jgi:predicted MPP superfamily phosphohydrolase
MDALKLAFTADLHLPITNAETISALGRKIQAFGPRTLVVGGDVGESLADVERGLHLLREQVQCPIWVLAGNHDLWARPPYDSRKLWLEQVPRAVHAAGCQWLEGTSFVLDDLAVAGTIAWYDYSAADPNVQASALEFAQQKFHYNADALRIDWEWSDPEFAELVSTPFLAQLDYLESDPSIRRVIVVTHVPIVEEQMPRNPSDPRWSFSNAYFGNLTLGRKVLAYSKVSHILSGHTHCGKESVVERTDGSSIQTYVVPSDYEKPDWVALSV